MKLARQGIYFSKTSKIEQILTTHDIKNLRVATTIKGRRGGTPARYWITNITPLKGWVIDSVRNHYT